MTPLMDVLGWRNGAKAFTVTEQGEKVLVTFTWNGPNGSYSFWTFYDANKPDRELDEVYQSLIDYDPDDTSQARLVQDLSENMDYRFGLDIAAPIWQEVVE